MGSGNLVSVAYPRKRILSGIKDIGCGISHSFFLQNNGALLGAGLSNRMGTGTYEFYRRPTRIRYDVASIAATTSVSFYTDYSGAIWATGYAELGQLGVGTAGLDGSGFLKSWLRVVY